MSGASIRFATSKDVPTILAFIKEAALETDAADAVKCTEGSLQETLIFDGSAEGKQGFAKAIFVIAPDKEIAGMAIFYYNYSTWLAKPGICLEELFVQRKYRKNGYARVLIRALARELRQIGGGRLEWVCLRENEQALGFYNSLGAKRMENWVSLRVDGEALEKLASDGLDIE